MRSYQREIFRTGLAAHLVGLEIEGHFLPFTKAGQPCPLHRTDVNEHILAAVGRLNETKALLSVKPLHNTRSHLALHRRESANRPHDLRAGSQFNPSGVSGKVA